MIAFVNAKINIGLQIVRRREDGYHDLQTIFYPIGKYSGTPVNLESFGDILEVELTDEELEFSSTGRPIACAPEKNLVYKAAKLALEESSKGAKVQLYKGIPDGAGIGGGSADAGFTLRMISSLLQQPDEEALVDNEPSKELLEKALQLGADCPFFLYNKPMYGQGVGEKLSDVELDLSGYWLVLVKPDVYISTKEAFAGVKPQAAEFDLRSIATLPINEWHKVVKNDFEDSVFPQFPLIAEVKNRMYELGASYASMSGSGSSVYGIFENRESAAKAVGEFRGQTTIEGAYLLEM